VQVVPNLLFEDKDEDEDEDDLEPSFTGRLSKLKFCTTPSWRLELVRA
jgi:hypothetical protein